MPVAGTSPLRTAARPGDEGLTSQEAIARLTADGPNVLPAAAQRKMRRALLRQLVHLLALLLWVAAGLALLAGRGTPAPHPTRTTAAPVTAPSARSSRARSTWSKA